MMELSTKEQNIQYILIEVLLWNIIEEIMKTTPGSCPVQGKLVLKSYPSGKYLPTFAHYFIRLLEKKGMLLRNYTQNIDSLERLAGISPDIPVEAHGSFATVHCIRCGKEDSNQRIKEAILQKSVPMCSHCKSGVLKPDIVFFGENLPSRFFDLVEEVWILRNVII